MLRTKHLKMAVVPMTLLALLSTAVPVASAQETTDESFYELTTTPSGGDMIVGEPGTTILFDSSNGELVDVLPPSEAEDYSVTVSRGCADSNAGCWAGGNALGDMQFAGTGTATGSWPYRNSYTTGNKSGQITFAINGVTYTPVAAGPWMRIATADGSGVDGVSVTRWSGCLSKFRAGVFGCRPFAFPAFSQAESVASRAPAHADVERVGGVGEVPCLLHVGFGLFFGLFAFVFGQPLVKPCLEPVGERLFRPDGLRGFLRGLWRRFASLRAFLWPFGRFRA